eukprot:SAG31_NODE_1310_length_8870_cov_2.332231_3_plen_74_part_00
MCPSYLIRIMHFVAARLYAGRLGKVLPFRRQDSTNCGSGKPEHRWSRGHAGSAVSPTVPFAMEVAGEAIIVSR